MIGIYRPVKISKEMVAASTMPLVLAILERGENYGYAIIQQVRELSDDEIEWAEGMLYPLLHWLEERKLVKSDWRKAESGRERKYYSITAAGRKALAGSRTEWETVNATLQRAWKLRHA